MTKPLPMRDRVVRAAGRLFLARSDQVAGVGEIRAAAEGRKGSFCRFFPSRSDLAVEPATTEDAAGRGAAA